MEKSFAVTVGKSRSQQMAAEGAGKCPECGNPLHYSKDEDTVECPYCSAAVDALSILPVSSASENKAGNDASEYAMEIESPVAALVYLEAFFKEYDWSAYKLTPDMSMPEICGLVTKIRTKFGDTYDAWLLDFESRITPFLKKLEALADLESQLLSLYKGDLTPIINSKYSLYESITSEIKSTVEKTFDCLKSDIEYAERFGADEELIKDMKLRFNEAAELYSQGVHDFESIKEVPAIQIAKEKLDRVENKRLHDEGIDAKATYEKAKKLFETSADKTSALRLFEAVREYADSKEYIAKMNEFFKFDSGLIKLAGKHFLLKKAPAPVFNVKKPEESEKAENKDADKKPEIPRIPIKGVGPTVSLHEVVSGRIYEPASVTGISYVLSYYGNKIFYIKRNRSLCSYDVLTRVETELDRGSADDYPREKLFWNKEGTAFYIRKKLPAFRAERRGCLRAFFSIFRRRPSYPTDTVNNYSLIKVDKVTNTVSVEIDRLVDITECYDNRLFYIAYPAHSRGLASVPSFMVCDLESGEKSAVLGDDCHIHGVVGENVIYTTWDPNEYNKMLFSYNLKTDVTTLIEANIFEYFTTLGERVYYRVGNKKRAPIFSNNLEGTERLELIDKVKEVYASFDGWIYLIRGKGRNTTLFKMSSDGKTSLPVCSDVKHIVSMTDSYTYYTDSKGVLHSVDNDGKRNVKITDDIETDSLIIDKSYIYFLRREPIGKDKNAASLYRVDLDGRNIKKLIFNVSKIQNYNEDSIYVYKSSLTRFVATERENGAVKSEKQVKYKVSRFSILDKKTETETEILAVGLPDDQENIEKRGCFRRNIKRTVTYEEISNKISYKKEGIAKVGEIFTEQTEIDIPEI